MIVIFDAERNPFTTTDPDDEKLSNKLWVNGDCEIREPLKFLPAIVIVLLPLNIKFGVLLAVIEPVNVKLPDIVRVCEPKVFQFTLVPCRKVKLDIDADENVIGALPVLSTYTAGIELVPNEAVIDPDKAPPI